MRMDKQTNGRGAPDFPGREKQYTTLSSQHYRQCMKAKWENFSINGKRRIFTVSLPYCIPEKGMRRQEGAELGDKPGALRF
jgi:hypothetical protein